MGIITVEPPQYDILFRYQPQDFLGPLPTPNDVESGEPLPNHNGSADLVRVREKFVMKYGSEGKTLKELWAELDKTRKTSIAKTLRTSFDQLRQLEHPGYFGNINGGPPLDDVFTGTQGGLDNITSPVATEEELINSVIHIYALETGDRTAHKVRYYHHVLPTVLCSNKAPVFTHNDLQRKNVIVQDDGTVVIIDWEYSSWYPNYWEYASAMFANGGWTDDWDEYLSIILDEYPNEALWVSTMKTEMWS